MKKTSFILVALIFTLSACHNKPSGHAANSSIDSGTLVHFENYFPLKEGDFKIFHITKGGAPIDTYFCKSTIIKGKEIFYCDNDPEGETHASIIGSAMFCQGVCYYENAALMYSPIFWKHELKDANIDYFEQLFPADVQLLIPYVYRAEGKRMSYKFLGFEDVNIDGYPFNHCLKLNLTVDWPTAKYDDTIWFQKNTGVVKWIRGTGRLEEIKL